MAAPPVKDTFDMSYTAAPVMQPPEAHAPVHVRMDFMHQQLDSLGQEKAFLGDLISLGDGDNERLQGGALCCAGL